MLLSDYDDEYWDWVTLCFQMGILLIVIVALIVLYIFRSEGRAVPRVCVDGKECWQIVNGDPQLTTCFPSVRCEAEALPPEIK